MDTKFIRQSGLWNPSEQRIKITIIGVGSSGSFLAFTLAKMGFKDIEIIDFDTVELHNIPNQLYRIKDIGKYKVEALKEIIKEFTDVDINANNCKIRDYCYTPNIPSNLDVSMDRIYILAVDNIDARKYVYDTLKGSPLLMIDGGVGGEEYSCMVIELDNEEHQKKYEAYLNAEHKDLPCGFQNILYTVLSECSEICNIVKRIDKKEKVPFTILRDMRSYKIIKGD